MKFSSVLVPKPFMMAIILVILITVMTFIAYQQALDNNLLNWEDRDYLINNPNIKALTWKISKHSLASIKVIGLR